MVLVGGNYRPDSGTFAAAGQAQTLFDDIATQFGIDQAMSHLIDRDTEGVVCQVCLAHPALKIACLEYALHF